MIKKKIFIFFIFSSFLVSSNISLADIQKRLINKITATKTLSFTFKQKIAEDIETGNCVIKYPLLMKCNYKNLKQKSIIANGKSLAIIKKKYKKIYYYPIRLTAFSIILQKGKILNLIRNNRPTKLDSNVVEFQLIDAKANSIKIFFDKNSLNLKGWETKDSYSNNVSFLISNIEINKVIDDSFFKIPLEKDL